MKRCSIDGNKSKTKLMEEAIDKMAKEIVENAGKDSILHEDEVKIEIAIQAAFLRDANNFDSSARIFESEILLNRLTKNVADVIDRSSIYYGDESGRTLSPYANKLYRKLRGSNDSFAQNLNISVKEFAARRNKGIVNFMKKIEPMDRIKNKKLSLYETYRHLKEREDFAVQNAKILHSLIIEPEEDLTESLREAVNQDPQLEALRNYYAGRIEHVRELFPEADKRTIKHKIASESVDLAKVLNVSENGKLVNNILYGKTRILLSPSEYETTRQGFIKNFAPKIKRFSNEEAGELFDIINRRDDRVRGTGLKDDKIPNNFSETSLFEKIASRFPENEYQITSVLTKEYCKSGEEILESGINKMFREKVMISMFGNNVEEVVGEVNQFIKSFSGTGADKEMKLSHLKEYKEFMKKVFHENYMEEIDENFIINAFNVFANKIAVPMALTGSSLNHFMEGTGLVVKDTVVHGKIDRKLASKILLDSTRNGTSLIPKIPLAMLYQLPFGQEYKKVIGKIAKKIDWSTLKQLSLEEQFELASTIKIATEEFANNHTNAADIGDDFLFGVPDKIKMISQNSAMDKFNMQNVKKIAKKEFDAMYVNIIDGDGKVTNAMKKRMKEAGITKTHFEYYFNAQKNDGDYFNEANIRKAKEEIIPKTVEDMTDIQRAEFLNNRVLTELYKEIGGRSLKTKININRQEHGLFAREIENRILNAGLGRFVKLEDLRFDRKGKSSKFNVTLRDDLETLEGGSEATRADVEYKLTEIAGKAQDTIKEKIQSEFENQDIETKDEDVKKYFDLTYKTKPERFSKAVHDKLDQYKDELDGYNFYLQKFYTSPLTQASIRRSLGGLGNKYYNINDLLINAGTMFVGVSAESTKQFIQALKYANDNVRTEQGKIDKYEFSKYTSHVMGAMLLTGLFCAVLTNIKNAVLGKDTDWSPSAIIEYGLKDDVFIGGFNSIVNKYDSYASKLLYSALHGDITPFLNVAKNNTLFLERVLN